MIFNINAVILLTDSWGEDGPPSHYDTDDRPLTVRDVGDLIHNQYLIITGESQNIYLPSYTFSNFGKLLLIGYDCLH